MYKRQIVVNGVWNNYPRGVIQGRELLKRELKSRQYGTYYLVSQCLSPIQLIRQYIGILLIKLLPGVHTVPQLRYGTREHFRGPSSAGRISALLDGRIRGRLHHPGVLLQAGLRLPSQLVRKKHRSAAVSSAAEGSSEGASD